MQSQVKNQDEEKNDTKVHIPEESGKYRYHYLPEGILEEPYLEDEESFSEVVTESDYVSTRIHDLKRYICDIHRDSNGQRMFDEWNLHIVKSEYSEEKKRLAKEKNIFSGIDSVWTVITDRFGQSKYNNQIEPGKIACRVGFVWAENLSEEDENSAQK